MLKTAYWIWFQAYNKVQHNDIADTDDNVLSLNNINNIIQNIDYLVYLTIIHMQIKSLQFYKTIKYKPLHCIFK